jgi:uncharacterized coiled-coil protein SlyX
MESAAKRRLGDIFVERGLITSEQLEEALRHQRETGEKLGEILVELGFVTRVALAGVISQQWDDLRLTQGQRKVAQPEVRRPVLPGGLVGEAALRERVEALSAELAERDKRIAQQDATITALLARLGHVAA